MRASFSQLSKSNQERIEEDAIAFHAAKHIVKKKTLERLMKMAVRKLDWLGFKHDELDRKRLQESFSYAIQHAINQRRMIDPDNMPVPFQDNQLAAILQKNKTFKQLKKKRMTQKFEQINECKNESIFSSDPAKNKQFAAKGDDQWH